MSSYIDMLIVPHYDPLVLGFIVNVGVQLLPMVRSQIIEVVRRIESDDRGYIFHPNNLEILRHSGPVVASISNYQPPNNFDLEFAIKQTIIIMNTQDVDARKHIFVIIDKFEESQTYGIQKAIKLDIKKDSNCSFILFGLNCSLPRIDHPRCEIISTDSESFSQHIFKKLWSKS